MDITTELIEIISELKNVTVKLINVSQLFLLELQEQNKLKNVNREMIERDFPVDRK